MVLITILSVVAAAVVALVAGALLGYLFRTRVHTASLKAAEAASDAQILRAEQRRKEILTQSNQEVLKRREKEHREIQKEYQRLREKENKLEQRLDGVDRRAKKLNLHDNKLHTRSKDLDRRAEEIEQNGKDYVQQLEGIANLTAEEARNSINQQIEQEIEATIGKRYTIAEKEAREQADQKARFVLAESIQRMAADVVSEVAVTSLKLSNEDIKGRLIGREGRNIRSIEKETGVELLLDETPGMVVLSSFDPVRREVARISVERLIRDGRIQPARVETIVAQVRKEMNDKVRQHGKEAMYEANLKRTLPNEIMTLMGQLKFRTSFGSNVLKHSIEVSIIAGLLASEIGADENICRMGGFLHDIGKALSHEIKGPHAEIGADLVQKHNLDSKIVTTIREHHDRQMSTTEAFIVAAADAVSAARPGARHDSAERYIERMKELENIARSFRGVDNCYALQSGHELRVLVSPNGISDSKIGKLASDIVSKIEEQYKFPGEINVTVIRESRVSKVAR